jgi:2-keto-4-pentenoate hydratase/2-oxohepta-3-ene-1,7-dioic acid hydratase in catechol pathway
MMEKAVFSDSVASIPLHTIFCIGRNYAEHARELNNPVPEAPIVFLKPLSALVSDGGSIVLPKQSEQVHHEVEIVVLIGKSGKNISEAEAHTFISGYAVGIDVTARDIQSKAKAKGHPWSVAKGFDTFAPISNFVSADKIADPSNIDVSLTVNGEIRQKGNSKDMLFPIPRLISYLSTIFTLHPGDLIFTGTPEGVNLLNEGDRLLAQLNNGLVNLTVKVKKEV